MTEEEIFRFLSKKLRDIPGGYTYSGICSEQICFPLKAGGELRFMLSEDDDAPKGLVFNIDHYDGSLPPGITGPASNTTSRVVE